MLVLLADVTVAALPPILTWVDPGRKLVPVMTIGVPPSVVPEAGVIAEIVGSTPL